MAAIRRYLHPLALLRSAANRMSQPCHHGHDATPRYSHCRRPSLLLLHHFANSSQSFRAVLTSANHHTSVTTHRRFRRPSTCRRSSTTNYPRHVATSAQHTAPAPRHPHNEHVGHPEPTSIPMATRDNISISTLEYDYFISIIDGRSPSTSPRRVDSPSRHKLKVYPVILPRSKPFNFTHVVDVTLGDNTGFHKEAADFLRL